jgi:hypothetical protein
VGIRVAFALVPLLIGCGAKLDSGPISQAIADGPEFHDAPIDVGIDARPCTGGDANAMDGTSCLVYFKGPAHHDDAKAACIAMSAHMVKIENATTNGAVAKLAAGTDTFIGATDVAVEGTFVWDDGTPVVYQNFRTGEPSNGAGQYQEDCLVIEGSKTPDDTWDDRPCAPVPNVGGGNYAYMCQY